MLKEVDDCVGIGIGEGKGLFFQVVDYGEGKEYLIELNNLVGDVFEPCAEYNASSAFGDLETLILTVERYLDSLLWENNEKKERKKKKFDFVLKEDEDTKLIFRFYPRSSHCHGFGSVPPTKWEEVYKVYYSYSIFEREKEGRGSRTLFECGYDECSLIDEVAARCLYLDEGKTSIVRNFAGKDYTIELLNNEMYPTGMGVSWNIFKLNDNCYEFVLFNWNDTGFRFQLKKEQLKEFGEYLKECCEYMLAHGEPI